MESLKIVFKFILIFGLLLLSSCVNLELGCILCKTKTIKKIERYDSGAIKTIYKKNYKSAFAIDVPIRIKEKTMEFDSSGNKLIKIKKRYIACVWWENFKNYKENIKRYD